MLPYAFGLEGCLCRCGEVALTITPNLTIKSHPQHSQLQLCWGLTPETLSALPSRITEKQSNLAHPSIYDDALPEAKFFCLLSDLLRRCGYREFGFRDLAAPQAKRFRRQLSALINFLKYREDMGHLEAQAMEEVSRFMCDAWIVFWGEIHNS